MPAVPRRIDLPRRVPEFYRAMLALDRSAAEGLDPLLVGLIRTRASQINGCAFCVDMHSRDAREQGEQEHRLYALAAWRGTSFFTARERAALALTESITLLAEDHVRDDVYDEAALRFDEGELARVIATVVTINALNRLAVTSRMSPPAR